MSANAPEPALYKKQERIYPKEAHGTYRSLKWLAMVITLAIYYLVPFIRWDRGPNAPDQAVLIDLTHGRAYWFWFEIWPQEIYILTGILVCAAIGLFFITSLFGRVWCGYLCFQTVWTDLFIKVEQLIQGDRNQRKRLREGKWTWEKIYKLVITHFLWLVIAWCTAGSFVLYFNDAPTLVRSFLALDVSNTVLIFIGGLTFSTYLMAGFAREQVCTYMCPYARFQSAMFDKDTLIIGYDKARGEPRGKHKKGDSWENHGHCIDCTACVQVCPMGIDIRDGLQMECIACGLCVDACNDIMDKIDLPRGLIRYDTENRMEQQAATGAPAKFHIIRPRSIFYACVLVVVSTLILYALLNRSLLDISVLHDRNPLFVTLSDGHIRNGYEIKILNKTHEHSHYKLSIAGLENSRIDIKGAGEITADNLYVAADSVGHYHVFVEAPASDVAQQDIKFMLEDKKSGRNDICKSVFVRKRSK